MLVLEGDAGIGKSALLEYARQEAGDSVVLRTSATEVESGLPYVHLADLLRPVSARIVELESRQAAALDGVLALGPCGAGDRYAVAAATLNLFSSLAADQPLVILIDDVHWLDDFSAEVLSFVGNRFDAEGALVLLTLRAGMPAPLGITPFPHLRLDGLDEQAARQLLDTTVRPLSSAVLTRVLEEAEGNPLALLELSAHAEGAGAYAPVNGAPLPVGERVERMFRTGLERVSLGCREALLLVAILGSTPTDTVRAALRSSGVDAAVLIEAESSDLLVDDGGQLRFRHPLIRSAVHQSATRAQRIRAHRHAADALVDSSAPNAVERRAWHLVCAGSGPDEAIADDLERYGATEYERSNFAAAATLFVRSSEIGPPGPAATGRLLRAADAYRIAGSIEIARHTLDRARAAVEDDPLALIIDYYIQRIDLWRGSNAVRSVDLAVLARRLEAFDTGLAAQFLGDAALASDETGHLETAGELCARAQELLSRSDVRPLDVDITTALTHALRGEHDAARALVTSRAAEVDAIDPVATGHVDQLGLVAAMAHLAMEDVERAGAVLDRAIAGAREASAVGVLPFRVGRLAWVRYWEGRWAAAFALANEALQLAKDTGWRREIPNSLAVLAHIASVTGDSDGCRSHAQGLLELAEGRYADVSAAHAHAALGRLALGVGDAETAVREFEQVVAFAMPNGLVDTPMLWWSGDLIEALAQLGRTDEATVRLADLETVLHRNRMPTLTAVAARSRGLLDPLRFDEHLATALRHHDRRTMPFEQARTKLVHGELLRRVGRSGAQRHLADARSMFDRLGARPWSRRAGGAHEPATEPSAALYSRLTPQELQVALHVGRGLSNREAAQRLFLSVKTVEFHLSNAYHKLGIRRRAQLAVIVAQQDPTVAVTAAP